ncbi:hypothetical protein F53441_8622 [Fusarium austroafricanum]|uniref:BTB domain-containing protein n=1 Tax=Fusarium austroafricanum TaxID=2364996 RepID=A0A8H4P4E4_9HYPO|nr:hypothetical protein F53441_8622 [Fusarium austroafricanum]
MRTISYEIDPGGDLELVLKEPNTLDVIPVVLPLDDDDATSSDIIFDNSSLSGRYSIFDKFDSQRDTEDPKRFVDGCPDEVRIKVSSRHLILASPVFRKMLEGPWSENASSSPPSEARQIFTTGWDAKALAIVLDVIHSRCQEVPKEINVPLLTRIATIVDYYQCHESLQFVSDVWLNLPDSVVRDPEPNWVDDLMILYSGWVFCHEGISSNKMKVVLRHSPGRSQFDLKDLPLAGLLGRLNNPRQEFVGRVLEGLHVLRKTLFVENGCPEKRLAACSSLTLGVLMRALHQMKRLDPPVTAPFDKYSVTAIFKLIDRFPKHKPSNYRKNYGVCSCDVYKRMQPVIYGIEDEIDNFKATNIQGWGEAQRSI